MRDGKPGSPELVNTKFFLKVPSATLHTRAVLSGVLPHIQRMTCSHHIRTPGPEQGWRAMPTKPLLLLMRKVEAFLGASHERFPLSLFRTRWHWPLQSSCQPRGMRLLSLEQWRLLVALPEQIEVWLAEGKGEEWMPGGHWWWHWWAGTSSFSSK